MATLKNTTINDIGFLQLPVGTTGERPTTSSGKLRYNTTLNKLEIYNQSSSEWLSPATIGVRATGGNHVYDVDVEGTTYRVHVFNTTGNSTFNVTRGGKVEYLIVAGGGAGGGGGGAGGGGGVLSGSTTITSQSYTITVGSGGSGATGNVAGANGGNSSALGLTAIGGGGGGALSQTPGTGGSGGGGNRSTLTGASGTTGQGNKGGDGAIHSTNGWTVGGGGGGAGSPGQNANVRGIDLPGNGGVGLVSTISEITSLYAAGGGAGTQAGTQNGGTGGLGGGGNGGQGASITSGFATSGTPNTGGGGGSANEGGGQYGLSGSGGSGIVIIRYPLHSEPDVQSSGKVLSDSLLLDLDFSKPTVYLGSGPTLYDSRLGPYGASLSSVISLQDPRTHRSYFDLNNVQITTPFLCSFIGGSNYTESHALEIWVKITSYPQPLSTPNQYGNTTRAGMLFGAASYGGIAIAWQGNTAGTLCNVYGYIRNDGGSRSASGYNLPLNTWTHLMHVNYGTGTFGFFVNGVLTGTGTTPTGLASRDAAAGQIAVARSGVTGGGTLSYIRLPCQVGLARVYKGPLTAVDVLNSYTATRWRYGV